MRKIFSISATIVILALLLSQTGWANIQHNPLEPFLNEEHSSLQTSKKDVPETLAMVSVLRKLNKSKGTYFLIIQI